MSGGIKKPVSNFHAIFINLAWAFFWTVAILALAIALVWVFSIPIEHVYEKWARAFNFGEFNSTLPYIYVGVIGIFATILAIIGSSRIARVSHRTQDTTRIIFEIRLSAHYQSLLTEIRTDFPVGKKADLQKYKQFLNSQNSDDNRKADAVLQILNYYEFLSAGIMQNNLDRYFLRETIRGMLCGLVFDMQDIIAYHRKDSPRALANLVNVYLLWADRDNKSEWDDAIINKLNPSH